MGFHPLCRALSSFYIGENYVAAEITIPLISKSYLFEIIIFLRLSVLVKKYCE